MRRCGDLVRAREAVSDDLRKKRQQLQSFLLRHGRICTGRKRWSAAHLRWIAAQKFEHPAQQIVFQDHVDAARDAEERLKRLMLTLRNWCRHRRRPPLVPVYQAMRGVSLLVSVTFAVKVGDVRRFVNTRQIEDRGAEAVQIVRQASQTQLDYHETDPIGMGGGHRKEKYRLHFTRKTRKRHPSPPKVHDHPGNLPCTNSSLSMASSPLWPTPWIDYPMIS